MKLLAAYTTADCEYCASNPGNGHVAIHTWSPSTSRNLWPRPVFERRMRTQSNRVNQVDVLRRRWQSIDARYRAPMKRIASTGSAPDRLMTASQTYSFALLR